MEFGFGVVSFLLFSPAGRAYFCHPPPARRFLVVERDVDVGIGDGTSVGSAEGKCESLGCDDAAGEIVGLVEGMIVGICEICGPQLFPFVVANCFALSLSAINSAAILSWSASAPEKFISFKIKL